MAGTQGDRVADSPVPDAGQPGAALLRLVEVMDTLRVSCPWDAKQTHETLAPYLLEECYEALEALDLELEIGIAGGVVVKVAVIPPVGTGR